MASTVIRPVEENPPRDPANEDSEPHVSRYQGHDNYHGHDVTTVPACQGYKDQDGGCRRCPPDPVKPGFSL